MYLIIKDEDLSHVNSTATERSNDMDVLVVIDPCKYMFCASSKEINRHRNIGFTHAGGIDVTIKW